MGDGSRFRGRKYGEMLIMVCVVLVWWGYGLPHPARSEKWRMENGSVWVA